jgi:hypothetical protein
MLVAVVDQFLLAMGMIVRPVIAGMIVGVILCIESVFVLV